LSSVISIDLADQVFEGIEARQLVVKKEPAFFNPPEEKFLLYTYRGELLGKLLKDEGVLASMENEACLREVLEKGNRCCTATARGRESKGLAVAISHSPS
nr:hypothetical protein [Tanacetum cinerariifolium]